MSIDFVKKELFPDAKEAFIFKLQKLEDIKDTCLFVPDTNALLKPFTTGMKSVQALKDVYKRLKDEDRIFVPAHAIREFFDNRATKLMELYDNLSKKMNQNYNYIDSMPILTELPEFNALLSHEKENLSPAIKEQRKLIQTVLSVVKSWQWNDPITEMYQEILSDRIMDDKLVYDAAFIAEFEKRNKLNIPPGYKDKGKESNSEGDLILWKEICLLGKEKQQNIVFITGDEKADWWHQSNKEAVYPRFELVDEFRRETGGFSFHLISLSKFLELFDTDPVIVQEVAETSYRVSDKLYYDFSNEDLKRIAFELISKLRAHMRLSSELSGRRNYQRIVEMRAAASDKEKGEIWERFSTDPETRELMNLYNSDYKSEFLIIRDELLDRLPESFKDKNDYRLYEYPTNPLGLEEVVTNLEILAKNLI